MIIQFFWFPAFKIILLLRARHVRRRRLLFSSGSLFPGIGNISTSSYCRHNAKTQIKRKRDEVLRTQFIDPSPPASKKIRGRQLRLGDHVKLFNTIQNFFKTKCTKFDCTPSSTSLSISSLHALIQTTHVILHQIEDTTLDTPPITIPRHKFLRRKIIDLYAKWVRSFS